MLKVKKYPKIIVMIIGHKSPEFLIDTAESIRYYNFGKYEIVFAIDFDKTTASVLEKKYGASHVFVSKEKNGWGRGILRTMVHALEYFEPMEYGHVITMDSDALCVGPFIRMMTELAEPSDVFFIGTIWNSPGKDHGFHNTLRNSGFLNNHPYRFQTAMAAGPCMMWTKNCINFFKKVGILPSKEFDKLYGHIHFAHDQLSTYLSNCGVGKIKDIRNIMEIRWRESLPTKNFPPWGDVPITHPHTSIIHPTQSNRYTEEKCRDYFRSKRSKLSFF